MDDGASFKTPIPDAKLFGGPDDGQEIQFASEHRPARIRATHAIYVLDSETNRYTYLKDRL